MARSIFAVVNLLVLAAILCLATHKGATVVTVEVYWQRATSVLSSCVCYVAHLGAHLCSKRQLRKNRNFGASRV